MPNSILDIIAKDTNGKCYQSYKYCADEELKLPTLDYDDKGDSFTFIKNSCGETDTGLITTKSVKHVSEKIIDNKPLFQFFLDGSRRTYKIDDIEINRNVYPIIAGQIGVACCQRKSPDNFKCIKVNNKLVLSLPRAANPNAAEAKLFFNNLKDKVNKHSSLEKRNLYFDKILSYDSRKLDDNTKYENLGIATIQDEMIETEKIIVASLSDENLINSSQYLIKDGSLQYKPMKSSNFKELIKYKNHYKSVVGVSKMFNPGLCVDNNGKSNADKIAELKLFHRTPVYKYCNGLVGNVYFGIWYVRIREKRHSSSPFAGVLKLEKILITDEEIENGLDSNEVDLITANIINERNPVCYGKDNRWANHLYPVYLTENFIKSKYLSDINFLNIF
ncbi:MAG: hypothetical protein PHD45_06600 [Bacteroidales bacterium]|jgi:hypothetical protein|nr:hypothetical protein [Bacteroidales bacterium]